MSPIATIGRRAAIIAAGTALMATVLGAPSQATGSGKITVGGVDTVGTNAVTGTNVGNLTFMSDAWVPTSCTSSSITGTVNRGTPVVDGATIGNISNLGSTGCLATGNSYPVTVASMGTWPIKVVGNPAPKANVVNIKITGVTVRVRSTGAAPLLCHYEFTGDLPGTLNVSTQRITIATTGYPLALQAFDSSGTTTPSLTSCAGEIWTGDSADTDAAFNLSVTGGALTF